MVVSTKMLNGMKRTLAGILAAAVIFVPAHTPSLPLNDAQRFCEEYESLNLQSVPEHPGYVYPELDIDENNPIIYVTASQALEISDDSYILYMGASWCPWCRNVVPVMLGVVKDTSINRIYYIDMTEERDEFVISDGKFVQTKPGTSGYNKLLKQLTAFLPDYTIDSQAGEHFEIQEKRITLPSIAIFSDGNWITVQSPIYTLDEGQSPYDPPTSEQQTYLYQVISDLFAQLA